MLQHEEQESTASPAQARITAEELTAAVAALEARQEEEAQRLSGTIPVGQAVQELGLDATPEQVWAEVQAQRARKAEAQAAEEAAARRREEERRARTVPLQTDAGAFVLPRRRRRFPRILAILAAVWAATHIFGGHPHVVVHGLASPPAVRFMNQIPDGETVYATAQTVEILAEDHDLRVRVYENGENLQNSWPLIRHDGKVYLRGYALPQPEQPGLIRQLHLYNDDNSGELEGRNEEELTVPLDGLRWKDVRGTGDWGEITVTDVHPDTHFHEDW